MKHLIVLICVYHMSWSGGHLQNYGFFVLYSRVFQIFVSSSIFHSAVFGISLSEQIILLYFDASRVWMIDQHFRMYLMEFRFSWA